MKPMNPIITIPLSENGRCCYPRSHIENAVEENAGEPETVIFLTVI